MSMEEVPGAAEAQERALDIELAEMEAGSQLGIETEQQLQQRGLTWLDNISGFIGGMFQNMDFGKAMLLIGTLMFMMGLFMKGNIGGMPRPVMFLAAIGVIAFGAFSKYGPGNKLGLSI